MVEYGNLRISLKRENFEDVSQEELDSSQRKWLTFEVKKKYPFDVNVLQFYRHTTKYINIVNILKYLENIKTYIFILVQ